MPIAVDPTDLIGEQFGMLTVKSCIGKDKNGIYKYSCECKCGKIKDVYRQSLLGNKSSSCGCARKIDVNQYIGKQYNDLVCLEYVEYKDGVSGHLYKFECVCGKTITLPINNVKSGNTTRCSRQCGYEILPGTKFGKLEIIEERPKNQYGLIQYLTQCECGELKVIEKGHLNSGDTKSCGCSRYPVLLTEDEKLINQLERSRFGHFIVRIKLVQRDNFKCFICKKDNEWLHVHHILPWNTEKDFRFSCKNLITLCSHCHMNYAHPNDSSEVDIKLALDFIEYTSQKSCLCNSCTQEQENKIKSYLTSLN
jgi:hypothetical protein